MTNPNPEQACEGVWHADGAYLVGGRWLFPEVLEVVYAGVQLREAQAEVSLIGEAPTLEDEIERQLEVGTADAQVIARRLRERGGKLTPRPAPPPAGGGVGLNRPVQPARLGPTAPMITVHLPD